MGLLFGVSCIEMPPIFLRVVWSRRICVVIWHLYCLIGIPIWMVCPLVHCP